MKGNPMALSVVLNLTEPVSVPDLERFLTFIPDGFDTSQDIRRRIEDDTRAAYLVIPIPPSE